jgi:hypothetical protein
MYIMRERKSPNKGDVIYDVSQGKAKSSCNL